MLLRYVLMISLPPPTLSLTFPLSLPLPHPSVYDDTLLHQQTEPLVINNSHLQPVTKQNADKKVVHRRMSLPDPKPGGCGEADDEGDRRASTGDFSVPIVTSVSPGVDSVTEGMYMYVLYL